MFCVVRSRSELVDFNSARLVRWWDEKDTWPNQICRRCPRSCGHCRCTLADGSGSIAMVQVVIESLAQGASIKDSIVEVLTAIDAILLGTVLLVIGYGLYELFVDSELQVPAWLQINDLDDLKSKLIGVVVAIIAVVFVGVFIDSNRADDVVAYGLGAGALVLALAVFAYATKKDSYTKKSKGATKPE